MHCSAGFNDIKQIPNRSQYALIIALYFHPIKTGYNPTHKTICFFKVN